jgi:hypothetical protein
MSDTVPVQHAAAPTRPVATRHPQRHPAQRTPPAQTADARLGDADVPARRSDTLRATMGAIDVPMRLQGEVPHPPLEPPRQSDG